VRFCCVLGGVVPEALLTVCSRRRAAKRRHIFSLGRQPQDQVKEKMTSRVAATDNQRSKAAAHAAAAICRPSGAVFQRTSRTLGLTPQAMNLTPLRGFRKTTIR